MRAHSAADGSSTRQHRGLEAQVVHGRDRGTATADGPGQGNGIGRAGPRAAAGEQPPDLVGRGADGVRALTADLAAGVRRGTGVPA